MLESRSFFKKRLFARKAYSLYTDDMQNSAHRRFDFRSILLLAIATLLASARLVITKWLPDLGVIATLTQLGLFMGVMIGYSRFKKMGTSIITLGYSLAFVPVLIYLIISPLLPPVERLLELHTRLEQALSAFVAQEPVEDPLIVLILLGLLFWIAALYANFALLRYQNGLAALLPSTLLILAIQYNDHKLETPIWVLGFYFFFAFLLLARLDYLNNYESWKKKNFFITPDAKIDLSIFSTITIAILLLFTWNLPSSDAEWKRITRWWDKTTYKFENTRQTLDNLFSAVDNPVELRGSVLYGSSLALGERSYQGTNLIALVDVPDPGEIDNPPPRYYWRVRSYDTYTNGAWSTVEGALTEPLSAQTPLVLDIDPESETAIFTFTNKAERTVNLLMPHQSYWADIDTFATYTELPEGAHDLNLLRATERLRVDDLYSVRSAPLAPTISELRAAGTEYPEWVTTRYLQLPENLPVDIRELALELTRGRSSVYDKARLITTYLRTEIEYSDTIPAPPVGRDPLEWFLFTWQEGYCNYSASAEVVMLRSLGIPARMVVGFAQGQKVDNGDFLILQKDAHAWPEVYFPEIGWVEFEPTANQIRLVRPLGEIEPEEEDGVLFNALLDNEDLLNEEPVPTPEPEDIEVPEDVDETENAERDRSAILFWGMIILVTVVAFFGIWRLNRKQVFLTRGLRQVVHLYESRGISAPAWLNRWLRWSESGPIVRAFHAINRSLLWLGVDIPVHLTPYERAEMLAALLPEENEAIMQLKDEHEKTLFSPNAGDIEAAKHASTRIMWAALKRKTQKTSEKAES